MLNEPVEWPIIVLLAPLSISSYLLAAWLRWRVVQGESRFRPTLPRYFALIALIIHACLLYVAIDIPLGHLNASLVSEALALSSVQNLSVSNVISLVLWAVSLLVWLTSFRQATDNLMLLIFPLSALAIVGMQLFPGWSLMVSVASQAQLGHVLLAVVTVAVLCLAACQAVLLAIQDRLLKSRTGLSLQWMPPLQTMEALLFQSITAGFVLLTLLLVTSWAWIMDNPQQALKPWPLLVDFAWLMFAVLLIGRIWRGWRGQRAIRWTLSGTGLVICSYFCWHVFQAVLI